ncbi:unnamed protein product [Anisakis simplex]|uniref:Bromodomain adjacent to zinc finger domain protein 1A (inferred by orthology to a human protein) n=1 Tax=Anisakis simplex TaxID=6269 RepID=A0A0M3JSH9_ANISI|nr:unnamed protein product [Anisakis simplex]
MPLLKKKEFKPEPWPPNLKPDDEVFFLATTNEVFLNYEDFFKRQITLNSMLWSCSQTGKSGLTFEEALESEKNAKESLEAFPEHFGRPILYLIDRLCVRGRLEELVGDIHTFVKDRYFVGEELFFAANGTGRKNNCRILNVSYKGDDFTEIMNNVSSVDSNIDAEISSDESKKPSSSLSFYENGVGKMEKTSSSSASCSKRSELRIGAVDQYTYTIQLIKKNGLEEDEGVRENITFKELSRSKAISSRSRLKLFIKNSCQLYGESFIVKKDLVDEYGLETLRWSDVFGGPMAVFPHTPLLIRVQNKSSSRKTDDGEVSRSSPASDNKNEESGVNDSALKRSRGRPKGSTKTKPFTNGEVAADQKTSAKTLKSSETKSKSQLNNNTTSVKKKKNEKLRKEIAKQQEELQSTFQQAKRLQVENLSRWLQDERLLSVDDVAELKQTIRVLREQERERIKEAKQREREALLEWKKPRDDLACDDLSEMPMFDALRLPDWMSEEDFGEYLNVYEFFQTFAELLPIREVRSTPRVTFRDVVRAVRSNDPRSAVFVELMHVLLMAKTECGNEEDGDEVDLNNREELPVDTNTDLDNKRFGERIKRATSFHENVRLTHGVSARHLPVDWMSISEVLRISLLSSGYFTGSGTHRYRLFSRGAVHFYEDDGFVFTHSNPEIMKTLEKASVFDLKPVERLALLKVLIHQLSTYHKFRRVTDDRIALLFEMKRELRKLQTWDMAQDKEAREARVIREYEAEQIEENGEAARADLPERPKPSRESLLLSSYLRMVREGVGVRRDDKSVQVKEILLTGVAYAELGEAEIDEVRTLQKQFVEAKQDEIISQIYDLYLNCGYCLGRDRAFRTYWCVDHLPLILIENASCSDEVGPCEEATPLDKVNEQLKTDSESETELRVKLLACTRNEQCPVHNIHQRPRWQYVDSNESLDKLVSACNSRGYREGELLENLNYFRNRLRLQLDLSAKKSCSGDLWRDLMLTTDDPSTSANDFDWCKEIVEMILDFEEKIEHGGIGHLAIDGISREKWRNSLKENHNVVGFIKEDIKVFNECVIPLESMATLSEVTQIAIAFLQVAQGVSFRFMRMPFAVNDSKDKTILNNIPTTTFQLWQIGLLKCKSISALALFYATLEPAILWSKSLLQAKCRICRKRGIAENLILCVRCDRCYHIDCVRPKLHKVCEEWMCSDCVAMQRAKEAEERRHRNANGRMKSEFEEDEYLDEGSDGGESSGSNSLFDDEMSSADENRLDSPAVEMQKTIGGRLVRKVQYREDSMSTSGRSSKRNSRVHLDVYDSEGAASNESATHPRSKRRRYSAREDLLSRSVTMGLRGADHERRDMMRSMESVLRDTLRQPSAWPFAAPVDARDVPDYYQIIKRPMDLRTMMNKLKQQLYDTPEQVVTDAKLMFDNCRIYNQDGSEIVGCADKLEEFMEKRFVQILGDRVENGNYNNHNGL